MDIAGRVHRNPSSSIPALVQPEKRGCGEQSARREDRPTPGRSSSQGISTTLIGSVYTARTRFQMNVAIWRGSYSLTPNLRDGLISLLAEFGLGVTTRSALECGNRCAMERGRIARVTEPRGGPRHAMTANSGGLLSNSLMVAPSPFRHASLRGWRGRRVISSPR